MPSQSVSSGGGCRANASAACFSVHSAAARFPLSTVDTNRGSSGRSVVLSYQLRVSAVARQTLHRAERPACLGYELGQREIAEMYGRNPRVQQHAEVRRRDPLRRCRRRPEPSRESASGSGASCRF